MKTKTKILYVDDEPINITNFTLSFQDDFEILSATSGSEALEIFRSQRPAVIITDQRMPGMTGVELLAKIYAEDPDPLRIILTAYSDFDEIKGAINEGHIYQFCQKPWNIDELRLTIMRAVEIFRLNSQNKLLLRELADNNKMLNISNIQLEKEIQIQQELRQERLEAEVKMVAQAKLASLGEMASGVAHEVNQPLTFLKIVLQAITRDLQNNTLDLNELQNDIRESLHQVSRIVKIADHLRTYGRSDTNEFTGISLPDTLENSLTLLRTKLKHSQVRCQQEKSENLPLINGNAVQLEQLFINLLQNSLDALHNTKEGHISIALWSKDDKVSIVFRDNGEGMPETVVNKMFEPFFTTKEIGKGTGLGLSIVNSIIHKHGGTITCDSVLGQGTTFTITLPTYNGYEKTP